MSGPTAELATVRTDLTALRRRHPDSGVNGAVFDDPTMEARWRRRFSAPQILRPTWARSAPHRAAYLSDASGTWQVHAWDRVSDRHTQASACAAGATEFAISEDGRQLWWLEEDAGDEVGLWRAHPWAAGDARRSRPVELPRGRSAGLALGCAIGVVGVGVGPDVTAYVVDIDRLAVRRELVTFPGFARVRDISLDEALVAVVCLDEHTGDACARVYPTGGGDALSEVPHVLDVVGFAPVDDGPVLIRHEWNEVRGLALWYPRQGELVEIDCDLPGDLDGAWYPGGGALLVTQACAGRTTLHRLELGTESLQPVVTPPGTILFAGVLPGDVVQYVATSSERPSRLYHTPPRSGPRPLPWPAAPESPAGPALTDVWVAGSGGPVHAMYALPHVGEAPYRTVFLLHGGPHSADSDRFSAQRALWTDAGFAVVHVNYRGSTGYGVAWQEAIQENPGLGELDDIAAVRRHLVETGTVDPAACALVGYSWGGYLTLLALGVQPELWAAGVAGAPIADLAAAYEEEPEHLRVYDRALFGGAPNDVPDRYTRSSPITYVDAVRAPLLVVLGENDSRCPAGQAAEYLERLRTRGVPYGLVVHQAGHQLLSAADLADQAGIEVKWVARHLPSVSAAR